MLNTEVRDNSAGNRGGGIASKNSDGTATATLTIRNSTIAGNSASAGGGVFTDGVNGPAPATISNVTVSDNTAVGDTGGVYNSGGVMTLTNDTVAFNTGNTGGLPGPLGGGIRTNELIGSLTLFNTIVARNSDQGHAVRADVLGPVDELSGANLIGDGTGAIGIANGTNGNLVGSAASPIDPLLGALANNGGLTRTRAPQRGSLALDAGDNTLASAAGLITDQRDSGFTRFAFSGVNSGVNVTDIGAVEAQPFVGDISDRTVLEDSGIAHAQFYVGDAPSGVSVTAQSSNQTLVPDAGLSVSPLAGLVDDLAITPVGNQSGTTTITLTASATVNGTLLTSTSSFQFSVTAVNDAPTIDAIASPAAIAEDSPQQTVNLSNISAGPSEAAQTVTVTATSDNPTLLPDLAVSYDSVAGTGTVTYTPAANAFGSAIVTV
ncbi:MAG TPA: choice-of-anchor Q domain-containing protein, partial [Thermomicrobiales bacterium]|nr:choice-of-anchor Q domain-containing protein [Thermomicrobiales bacterium]